MAKDLFIHGAIYVGCSSLAVLYNSWLMQPERFPLPVALATVHTATMAILATTLYAIRPDWFPFLLGSGFFSVKPGSTRSSNNADATQDIRQTDPVVLRRDGWFFVRRVSVIAVFFSLSVVFNNAAYMYCAVGLTQMVKQSSAVVTYVVLIAVGMEQFDTSIAAPVFGAVV